MPGKWSNIFLLGKKDMNGFHLNRVEQVLFALVGSGLALMKNIPGCQDGGEGSLSGRKMELPDGGSLTAKEWEQCYRMACKQGVMAIAWDGVMKLPKELQPPVGIKIQWAMAVEKYEKQYLRYCRTIESLSQFYKENGIATVQMKGVGLSTYYPQPMHREGGDIDIYTFALDSLYGQSKGVGEVGGKVGKGAKTEVDVRANTLADELMGRQGVEVELHTYKHSNFFYKSVPIENHKCFLNVKHYKYGAEVNGILEDVLAPEPVELPLSADAGCVSTDGVNQAEERAQILIPSLIFNAVFVPFHAFQHYGTGISLHHLSDWAMILTKGGLDIWPQNIRDQRLMTAIAAFTILSDELLGTRSGLWQENRAVATKSTGVGIIESVANKEKAHQLAGKMLQEIMYPPYSVKEIPVKGKFKILVYKTMRMLHRHLLLKDVFEISLFVDVWRSIISHVRNPHTIFGG